MLKYLPLGAALATIVSTQIPLNIPEPTANQRIQVSQLASPNPQAEDNGGMGKLLTVALVGGTAAGVILSTRKATKTSDRHSTTTQIDRASPKLRKQLLTLLHNDKETADRLVAQIKRNNPNQSTNWAAEKAIYDLERDRGGR